LPAVRRYQEKPDDDRYQIRRTMRNFCRWYRYMSQVVRTFDEEMHREYVYDSYLVQMLSEAPAPMENIQEMLVLVMYKLEKTFDGDVELDDSRGVYTPAEPGGASAPEDEDPLDEVIERINEEFKGNFTPADRVMIGALADKLRDDKRLANMARSSDRRIFAESIFPQAFENAAQESYMESQETYVTLFEDKSKYMAIMNALASMVSRDACTSDAKG
jgi:type I restriction enzyme R subunit